MVQKKLRRDTTGSFRAQRDSRRGNEGDEVCTDQVRVAGDDAMLKFHDEIAQGLSGLWWQTNAALAEAKSHGVPETALHALETVRSESLRLLREAQDAATFRTAESAGRFIVPALEDELESFREATGLQLTLQVCGDAKSHSAESLANLYRAFRSRLDDLACDAVIREGSVVVVFDRDEPQVEFSGKQSLTQG